jgi:hypothetical protein
MRSRMFASTSGARRPIWLTALRENVRKRTFWLGPASPLAIASRADQSAAVVFPLPGPPVTSVSLTHRVAHPPSYVPQPGGCERRWPAAERGVVIQGWPGLISLLPEQLPDEDRVPEGGTKVGDGLSLGVATGDHLSVEVEPIHEISEVPVQRFFNVVARVWH